MASSMRGQSLPWNPDDKLNADFFPKGDDDDEGGFVSPPIVAVIRALSRVVWPKNERTRDSAKRLRSKMIIGPFAAFSEFHWIRDNG